MAHRAQAAAAEIRLEQEYLSSRFLRLRTRMPECDDFQAKECHQGNQEFFCKGNLGSENHFPSWPFEETTSLSKQILIPL